LYVSNDPYNYVDPSGYSLKDLFGKTVDTVKKGAKKVVDTVTDFKKNTKPKNI